MHGEKLDAPACTKIVGPKETEEMGWSHENNERRIIAEKSRDNETRRLHNTRKLRYRRNCLKRRKKVQF